MAETQESQEPTEPPEVVNIVNIIGCIGLIGAVIAGIIVGAPIISEFAKSLFAPTATPTPTKTSIIALSPTITDTPTLTPVPLTSSPIPTPTSTPTLVPPTDTPTLQPTPPTPTPLPTVMIEAEWPKKMEIDRSDSIRVSLVRTTDQVFVPTIEIAGHTVIAASPIPVGTLTAPIEKAFGTEYKASAIANLAGTAFKISPVTNELQSLEQPRITWEWNIMPEKPGPQTINASIQVQWEPIGGDGETIQRPIWRSRLDTLVEEPLIATGQLNAFSLVSAFVGSVLSVPWLYERIKERREKRQKDKDDKESKPKILLARKG